MDSSFISASLALSAAAAARRRRLGYSINERTEQWEIIIIIIIIYLLKSTEQEDAHMINTRTRAGQERHRKLALTFCPTQHNPPKTEKPRPNPTRPNPWVNPDPWTTLQRSDRAVLQCSEMMGFVRGRRCQHDVNKSSLRHSHDKQATHGLRTRGHSYQLPEYSTGARFTKYLTTILRLSYDNAKVTIDLR